MDLATLGLEIRSDGVVVAKDRLRDFEDQAKRVDKATDGLSQTLGRMKNTIAAVAAALGVAKIIQYADAWSDMQSRVGAAIKNMDAAPAMMQRMVDLANASYSPLEQTVEVYSRNVGVLRDLGYAAGEAADFTESLNHMLVITATKGERAQSVQNALAKAMAVGKLQTEGLETVLASGGRVAEALAAELETNVSGLRNMATQGKITGDVIAKALLTSLEDVRAEAAEMPATVGDAFTRIQTNTTALIGTLDQAWGATGRLAELMLNFADSIRSSADTFLRMGNIIGSVVGPAFDLVSSNTETLLPLLAIAAASLTGIASGAILTGLGALAGVIAGPVVGAVMALNAALMANPILGWIGAVSAVVAAIFIFRDQIKQAIGIDVVEIAKAAGNMLIQSFDLAFRNISTIWGSLPSVLGDITISTANAVVSGIESMINGAIGLINDFTRGARSALGAIGLDVGDIGKVSVGKFDNPHAGALGGVGAQMSQNLADTSQIDYLGAMATSLGEVWSNAEGATAALAALSGDGEGGGGGGGGKADKADAYAKLTKSIYENIAALEVEAEALGLTEFQATKLSTAQELLRAAAEAGRPLTAELIEDINSLAYKYAEAEQVMAGVTLAMSNPEPWAIMREELASLDIALARGKISLEQYNAAAVRSMAGAANATLGSMGQITGALASAFEGNKAFAIANAVINTAEGVTKALAQGGMFSFPIAAALAAAGAAQIATIMSASPGGGSSGSIRTPSAPTIQNAPQREKAEKTPDRMDITLHGLDRGSLYSGENIESFLRAIEERAADGRILNIKVA